MKIRPVEAQFFRADRKTDRQTDWAKLIVAFHRLSNASKERYNEEIVGKIGHDL
jgi:hypothetical protein